MSESNFDHAVIKIKKSSIKEKKKKDNTTSFPNSMNSNYTKLVGQIKNNKKKLVKSKGPEFSSESEILKEIENPNNDKIVGSLKKIINLSHNIEDIKEDYKALEEEKENFEKEVETIIVAVNKNKNLYKCKY